ncbi:MAG: anaerobic ribonucleoside-triphosphate reductase activating protein [Anaeroplasmataceae bacterium]
MRYHDITKCDMLNGDGIRVVLWVSGCSHNCEGCHNPITHDPNDGVYFDSDALKELLDALKEKYVEGLTLSGGDPLYISNREEITNICKIVKKELPDKNIWLYTGYNYEEISDLDILNYIDVLVDGPFIIDKLSPNKKWVGSHNQRVIDMKKTKLLNKIVLKEGN